MTLHFNDKSCRCRYSPHLIHLSLALYFRSKNLYDRLRNTGLTTLPRPSTLKKTTCDMKFEPRFDPTIYVTMNQYIIRSPSTVQDHLMIDEIRLKNVLAWNFMNNEVTGFISDEMSTSKMFENILGLTLDKNKNKKHLAVYANQ